jgi:isoleucyl-tRNA synthetase
MAEELFKSLTERQSVHLEDWPAAGHVDELAINRMQEARRTVSDGLAQRASAGIKVRQPLASVTLTNPAPALLSQLESEGDKGFYGDIIREELNVKKIDYRLEGPSGLNNLEVGLDINLTPELKREGLARELIRFIQNARKNAGLNVDDRINLSVETSSPEVKAAFDKFKDEIYHETLATGELKSDAQHSEEVKLDGQAAQINLSETK